jgi:3-hydroxy-D-aspartate aldolase
VLIRSDESTRLRLGDKTLLVPGHGGTTVNLHDWLVATRKGRVEAVWPIEARGRTY